MDCRNCSLVMIPVSGRSSAMVASSDNLEHTGSQTTLQLLYFCFHQSFLLVQAHEDVWFASGEDPGWNQFLYLVFNIKSPGKWLDDVQLTKKLGLTILGLAGPIEQSSWLNYILSVYGLQSGGSWWPLLVAASLWAAWSYLGRPGFGCWVSGKLKDCSVVSLEFAAEYRCRSGPGVTRCSDLCTRFKRLTSTSWQCYSMRGQNTVLFRSNRRSTISAVDIPHEYLCAMLRIDLYTIDERRM